MKRHTKQQGAMVAAAALITITTVAAAHAQSGGRPSRPGGGGNSSGGGRAPSPPTPTPAPAPRPTTPTRLPEPSSPRPAAPGQLGGQQGGRPTNPSGGGGRPSAGGGGGGGYRPVPPAPRPPVGYPPVYPYDPGYYPHSGYDFAPPVVVLGPYPGTYQGTGNLSNVLIFPGYRPAYQQNVTVVSPFGPFYACPRYIERRYVTVSTWAYLGGREVVRVQPWSEADAYMGADAARAAQLRAALNDLTRFWENGDVVSLRRHLSDAEEVGVFHNGEFLYTLRRPELTLLAVDVLDGIDTLAFRFTDVQRRDDGLVTATARHQYRVRETGQARATTVRCTLRYRGGVWVVTGLWLAS